VSAGLHSAAPIEQDACAQANADRLRRHRPRLTVARLNGPGCDVEVIVLGGGFAGAGHSAWAAGARHRQRVPAGGADPRPRRVLPPWRLLLRRRSAAAPTCLRRHGLTPVLGQAGLLADQTGYRWAELRDARRERLT